MCEPRVTLVPHLCPDIRCGKKYAAVVKVYFIGIPDSSMAAFDLVEVTVNCYVNFVVDIIGITMHGLWSIIVSHRLKTWHLRLNITCIVCTECVYK
jgi:hypothetical protein